MTNSTLDQDIKNAKSLIALTSAAQRSNKRSRSRLKKHSALIIRLRDIEGFSFRQIALVLRKNKRIKMTPEAVRQFYHNVSITRIERTDTDLFSHSEYIGEQGSI